MSLLRQTFRVPEDLQRAVCRTDLATGEIVSAVLDCTLKHCKTLNRIEQARRIRELIETEAWTDAALAMVALARSRAVRRLSRDDGEWHCTIGSQWPVPDWLDDTVEFSHAALPLAILGALTEMLGRSPPVNAPAASVPKAPADSRDAIPAVSCDNYL